MKLKTEKLEKLITENMVSNYANVSGDFNPIHLDDEYAKNTEFKNKIEPISVTLNVTKNISFTPSISKLLERTLPDPHIKAATNIAHID